VGESHVVISNVGNSFSNSTEDWWGVLTWHCGQQHCKKWSTIGIQRHSAEAIQNVLFADIYWAVYGVGMPDTKQDALQGSTKQHGLQGSIT